MMRWKESRRKMRKRNRKEGKIGRRGGSFKREKLSRERRRSLNRRGMLWMWNR
jgi:hypothetical protein